ncbi:MAG: T9SS type A sorting domain-containing protein [Flavobacterium sp.]
MKRCYLLHVLLFFCFHLMIAQEATLDASFDPGFNTNSTILSILQQADGKFVVSGHFDNRIVRLNSDGTLDNTFTSPGLFGSILYSTAFTSEGKILVGGEFTTFYNVPANRLVRLFSNGTLDSSFNIGAGANNYIRKVIVLPDGKILIAGRFTQYNGIARAGIARLNSDGTLDSSFNPGTGLTGITGEAVSMSVQTDGKILLSGFFTSFNGISANRTVRLNPDGSHDATFSSPFISGGAGGINNVDVILSLPDGKIMIGGNFTTVGGFARSSIARLNNNGTVDTTFVPNPGAQTTWGTTVSTVTLLNDENYLVGGTFATFNGVNRSGIVKVTSNGALDSSFDPGAGVVHGTGSGSVAQFLIQSDGKIVIGGHFLSYNGTERRFLARLNGSAALSVLEDLPEKQVNLFPNPSNGEINIHQLPENSEILITDLSGKIVWRKSNSYSSFMVINLQDLVKGIYLIQILSKNQSIQKKLILK